MERSDRINVYFTYSMAEFIMNFKQECELGKVRWELWGSRRGVVDASFIFEYFGFFWHQEISISSAFQ